MGLRKLGKRRVEPVKKRAFVAYLNHFRHEFVGFGMNYKISAAKSNEYIFITRWQVEADIWEVSNIIGGDARDLVRWWPSVYLDVKILEEGLSNSVGRVVELYTKGWLPYTLRWKFKVTASNEPYGFTLEAFGDFVGTGIWAFTQNGKMVDIVYDWRIKAEKGLLKRLSFLMKPLFSANHTWAMQKGYESLLLELKRVRAKTPEEKNKVPAPPGPTFPHNFTKGMLNAQLKN